MEWKITNEVKGESEEDIFEERANHAAFKLKRDSASFYIFGGSSKYSRYNDVVRFRKQENLEKNQNDWYFSIISKGNSYEEKKGSVFGFLGFGRNSNNTTGNNLSNIIGPQFPSKREGHTCVKQQEYVIEEQVILFGGFDGTNYLNDVWILDTNEWKWTKVEIDTSQGQPCGRSMHTSVVYNDCMWVFGGYNGGDPLSDFWCLDLETKIWSNVSFDKTKAPEARYGHTSVVLDMTPVFEAQAKKLYMEMKKNKDINPEDIGIPTVDKNQYHMVVMFGFSNIHAMYIGKISEKLNTKQFGGTCYNDFWTFNFNTSKWTCLTDPSKSADDDKDKGILTKMVDATKNVTTTTVSQIKGIGKQLEISGKTAYSEISKFIPFYTYSSTTSYGSVPTTLSQPPDERYLSSAVYIGRGCILIFGGVRDYTHRRDCFILDLYHEKFISVPRMLKLDGAWPTSRKGHIMIYDEKDDCVYLNGGSNFKQGIQQGIASINCKQLIDMLNAGIENVNLNEKDDDVVQKAEREMKNTEKSIYEDVKVGKSQDVRNQLVKTVETETIKIRKNPTSLEPYRTRCECYMKLNMWEKAKLDAEEGLRISPTDGDLETKKASILFKMNDYISARLLLTEVINREEGHLQKDQFPATYLLKAFKTRAKCRLRERNFNEAINDCNRFLRYIEKIDMLGNKVKDSIDSVSVASLLSGIYIAKATAFEKQKQYDQALVTITSAKEQVAQFLKKMKKSTFFTNFLSFKTEKPQDVYLREKLEKFEVYLNEKKEKGKTADDLYYQAQYLIGIFKQKQSEIDAEKLKEQKQTLEEQSVDSFFEEYLFKEIEVAVEKTECEQAIEFLKQAIGFDPHEVKFIVTLSEAYYLAAEYKTSLVYAKKVMEMAVDYWKGYFLAASCCLARRKVPTAIKFLEQGIENCEVVSVTDYFKDVDNVSDKEGFEQLQSALESAQKQRDAMEQATEMALEAKRLASQGEYEEALKAINDVIEMDPTNTTYLVDKVDILIEKKKYLNALKVAILATRLAPQNYQGYLSQGIALQFLKRYYHSIKVLEKASQMFPENSAIKNQYLKSKELYKKKQFAQMKYERASFMLNDIEQELLNDNPNLKLYKIAITSTDPPKKIATPLEQILSLIDEAIDLYPFSVEFYLLKAKCRFINRNYMPCVIHVKEAVEVMKQITDGLYLSFLSLQKRKVESDEKREDDVDRINNDIIHDAIALGARAYASIRQFDIANAFLKEMISKHSPRIKKKIEEYEKHLFLSDTHIQRLERLGKTIENFKKSREQYEKSVAAGLNYKDKRDFKNALASLSEAISLIENQQDEDKTQDDRDYANVLFERAECFFELCDFESATNDAQKAVQLEKNFPHFYVLLCKSLMNKGDLEESIEKCDDALSRNPFNTPLNDVWQRIKLQTANIQAEKYFSDGEEAINNKEIDVAISYLSRAIKLRPQNVQYRLARAKAYQIKLKYAKALEDVSKALKSEPTNIIAIRLKAEVEVGRKNFSEAKALLQSGLDMYPNDQVLKQQLEQIIKLEGQWNEAYNRSRDAEECFNNGNYEQSLENYSIAIQLHPDCSQYLCRRARVLLKLSQPEAALIDAQQAIALDTSEEVYATLATIYLEVCDYEKAKETIEESLTFDDEENMDTLLMLKDEIYDREAKSIQAKEKDEEGQMYFERYIHYINTKKEEKDEAPITSNNNTYNVASIFSKLSLFHTDTKDDQDSDEDEDEGSMDDLETAQELFSEAVLLEPNNKRYLRHHIESLMLDKDPDRHEEAFNQASTMIQMFPNYTDGFCTAARLNAEKFRNTFEALFLAVVGLEHDRQRPGLSQQLLETILKIIDRHEIPQMKNSKTLKLLGKVQDKAEVSFETADIFEELEGKEILDNIINSIKTPNEKKLGENDEEPPSMSLDQLLDEDVGALLGETKAFLQDVADEKSIKKTVHTRNESIQFTNQLYDLDKHSAVLGNAFSNVRAFVTGLAKVSVTILKSQREQAFDLAAKALYVMYYDVQNNCPTDKFYTLFDMVCDACFISEDLKEYKLRELKKNGAKNMLLETCTERYYRFVKGDDHPFYNKSQFESDTEYNNFIETEEKNISELLSQFKLNIDRDIKRRHDNADEDLRYRQILLQQFIDCMMLYSLYVNDLGSNSNDAFNSRILSLSDEVLEIIQAVSNFFGYGDGVFSFLILLEKLGRQFKHTSSEIGNVYKCLLYLIRTLVSRNLTAGSECQKDKMLDDDITIPRYYLAKSEVKLFNQASKVIKKELNFIIDNHWKSTNQMMDQIIIFSVKVSTLLHAFSCIEDPEGKNLGYKSLFVSTREGIENSIVNLFDFYREKIVSRITKKDKTIMMDESGGLHPVHLLCLIEVLLEHIPRHEIHFDAIFPSNIGLMKIVCSQIYSNLEIELHKFKMSKFRHYIERGELPLGLFELPGTIEKIYQLLSEHANVQPYHLKDLFIPYVYKWIDSFEVSAKRWAKKAVEISDWKPITEEVTYTSAVVDTFTSLRQSLSVLESNLEFMKTEMSAPAQYAQQTLLDAYVTTEDDSSKYSTGNASLEVVPLIYVTFSQAVSDVIQHFADVNFNIFLECTQKMKKLEEEYVSRKTVQRFNDYKDMFLLKRSSQQQQQQDEKLFEDTRKQVHNKIISKMALCINNILETITQVKQYTEDIQKQLLKQQLELINQMDGSIESLDDESESQSTDLTTTNVSSSALAIAKKRKDDLLEGMKIMYDTMKILYMNLKELSNSRMGAHLSQLIYKTLQETLLSAISKFGQPQARLSTDIRTSLEIINPQKSPQKPQVTTPTISTEELENEFNQMLHPLFDYLDEQLALLFNSLHPDVFNTVLKTIFNSLIDELKELAVPPIDKPLLNSTQIDKFKTTFESFIEYFNAGGSGLDKQYLEENFDFLAYLFNATLKSTDKLIKEYNNHVNKVNDLTMHIDSMKYAVENPENEEGVMEELRNQVKQLETEREKRIIRRNYVFAILHRRSADSKARRINDELAVKFVNSETTLFESTQTNINNQYEKLQKSIRLSKDTYQQYKQTVDNLKKEVEGLRKQHKNVKTIKKIIIERKNNRSKCKKFKEELDFLKEQTQLLEKERDDMKELAKKEATIIERDFLEWENSYCIKDLTFRLDAFVRSCKKGIAGQLGDEFMNFLKFPTKVVGVSGEENKQLIITDFFRCMFHMNDGFLCLLSSPDICIAWIPITSLYNLFKIDSEQQAIHQTEETETKSMLHYLNPLKALKSTAELFTSEDKYNTHIDYIKIPIGKVKTVFRSSFGGALNNSITVSKANKEFEFTCFKDRDTVYDVIQSFILKNASEFKAKESSIVNKLLFINNTTKDDDKDSDITSHSNNNIVIPTLKSQRKGYPVSDTVRKIFNLKQETRLFNKYSCTEFGSKMIGDLYVFTDSICFNTTVNSGQSVKMILPFSQIVKISKVDKKSLHYRQSIQLTNSQRVSYTFVNFKSSDETFQEIIETIRKNNPDINIILKAEDTIAVFAHPNKTETENNSSVSKYTKFFKL
ncbi:hypothetical protein ABK040_009335 [Willaertia magna]